MTIEAQKTDLFSMSGDEIVVSKNIATVLVSLKISISTQSTAESRYILFERVRNGISVGGGNMVETYCVANKTTTIVIPMSLTDLQANDHIIPKIYGQSGDKIYRGNARIDILGFDIT